MKGTCEDCGTFVRGEICPHCGHRTAEGTHRLGKAALLLGLTLAAGCPSPNNSSQADYGAFTTDTMTETGDTGQE